MEQKKTQRTHGYFCHWQKAGFEKIKISFNPSRLLRDSMVFFDFLIMVGVSKKGLSSSTTLFVSQCTVRLVDKPQDTAGNAQSCSGNLYVMYSELRSESQGESRKRVAGESLPDDFIKFMITDAEKSRTEQKPSTPKAKKNNQGGKTAGRYFESP